MTEIVKCPRCNGTGGIGMDMEGVNRQPCTLCEGSGLLGTNGSEVWPMRVRANIDLGRAPRNPGLPHR